MKEWSGGVEKCGSRVVDQELCVRVVHEKLWVRSEENQKPGNAENVFFFEE